VAVLPACGSDRSSGTATSAGQGFAILSTDSGLAVTDGIDVRKLTSFAPKDGNWNGAAVAWRDHGTAVVVSGDMIGIVDAIGEHRIAPCMDCRGVALAGDIAITARANYRAGDGFDLVEFDSSLSEIRSTPSTRLNERWLGIRTDEDSRPPDVLAATDEHIYLTYVSRLGGARRGPEVVARYSRTGQLLSYLMIDGRTFDAEVSPDQRYLALTAGGSGGACNTTAHLRVVDLAEMRELDTYPDRPLARMTSSGTLSDPWFYIDSLRWADGRVVVTGQVHAPPRNETCDPAPQSWIRTYDVRTQTFTDALAESDRATQVIGPTCGDTIGYTGADDKRSVVAISGGIRREFPRSAVLAATSGSLSC
jgi:hypothetical protein